MKSGTRLREAFKKVAVPVLSVAVALGASYGINAGTKQELEGVKISQTESRYMRKGDGFGFTKTTYQTAQGEFQNTWSPLNGKFSSSEIEAKIKVGETYDITVVGLNVPTLGWYPNIISAKPAAPKPPSR